MPTQVNTPIFWIHSHQRIDELGKRLQAADILGDFSFDHENRFAWIEAKDKTSQFRLNISQQHQNGEPVYNEPVCFVGDSKAGLLSTDKLYSLAKRVANALNQEVFWGRQEYIARNYYHYRLAQIIQPAQTPDADTCPEITIQPGEDER